MFIAIADTAEELRAELIKHVEFMERKSLSEFEADKKNKKQDPAKRREYYVWRNHHQWLRDLPIVSAAEHKRDKMEVTS